MSRMALPVSRSLSAALLGRAVDFVAAPASPRPLAVLRIGLAAVLLVQGLCLVGSLEALYGSVGIVQQPIADALLTRGVPRASWAVEALAPLGLNESASLRALFFVYLAGLAGLLVGWHTRAMAAVALGLHLMLKSSSHLSAYGAYEFAHIALFYCMLFPVGHALSLDRRAGRVSGGPSADARLGLRVLQLHLCVVYFASGVEKATGEQWWNGEAVWRAVLRPDFMIFDMSWLAEWPRVAMLACWATLAIEIGYAFLIWPRWTRRAMALATVGLHLGIGVFLGLWAFAALMIVLNIAAFLVPADPASNRRRPVTDLAASPSPSVLPGASGSRPGPGAA